MKKLALTTLALAAGTVLGFSQGTIALNTVSGLVTTNNGAGGVGLAGGASSTWYYEVLDMTASSWSALTPAQRTAALGISALTPSGISLWTDSGISAANSSLHAGGINGASAGVSAANWAAPAGSDYTTAPSWDYYVIVGWSSTEGTSWSTVANELLTGTGLVTSGPTSWAWFGESAAAYNYSGGGPSGLTAPNVFSASSFTGLAGSGGLTGLVLSPVLLAVPEPGTLAVMGLGGLAMLLIRRRK